MSKDVDKNLEEYQAKASNTKKSVGGDIISYTDVETDMVKGIYGAYGAATKASLVALVAFTIWLLFGLLTGTKVESSLYFLDIGQGDAQLLVLAAPEHSKGSIKVLIDAGRAGQVLHALDDALESKNDKYIDILITTHAHEDHYGGFLELLKNYEVGLFIHNGQAPEEKDAPLWGVLLNELAERKVPTLALKAGDTIRYGETELAVLLPTDALIEAGDANEASLVILADIKEGGESIRALFTGDIGFTTEDTLLEDKQSLKADILKVGHHGSNHSTSENFVHAVRPVIAGIGVGENRYGHPHERVLATLAAAGTLVYTTKDRGTIKVPLNRSRPAKMERAEGGMLANIQTVLTGSYLAPRLTTVTLSQAKAEGGEFSLVAHKTCHFNEPQGVSPAPVRINEVAWMVALSGATHEWVELKKMTAEAINITGWQLVNENERVHALFTQGSAFTSDFLILARNTADTALGLEAELIFTGALRNADEGLRLFDNECRLVDEVFAAPNWPAGVNNTKQTMERGGPASWTNSAIPGGTPRR